MSEKFKNKDNDKDYLLMGIDLGTSTLKVGVYNLSGKELAYQSIEYGLLYFGKDLIENDLEKYWKTLTSLIKKALKQIGNLKSKILALSISSQGETIVPVDVNIKPLRNAIVWLDGRSGKQAKEIAAHFPEKEMYKITGQPISDPSWPASRIKWLQENEPEIFSNTYKYLLIEDYIAYKFTGKIFGERTVYNSSYYFDINNLNYYQPMLSYLKISKEKLPEIIPTGTLVGNITIDTANELGLSSNVKFVAGAMDQIAGAIGAGNLKEGMATETTGTAFAMVITTDKSVFDFKTKIPVYLHGIEGKYCLLPYSMTGGAVLKWFKDNFFNQEEQRLKGQKDIYNLMTKEAGKIIPGSEGLIMLPHLTGAYIPENNPDARGVFYGIGITHTRAHFTRAIMESIGFMMRNDIELLDNLNINITKILSMGGGAKSSLWNQIKADITDIEINVPEYTETAVLGAAIIAGVGVGVFNNFFEATQNLVKAKSRYVPNIKNKEKYDLAFKKYKSLYKCLETMF